MVLRKNGAVPVIKIKKGDSLKTIYAKARRAFTADDLARYAQDEPMIPMEQLIAELEAIQHGRRKGTRKTKKRRQ
jgi:hypothetical protein